MDYFIEFMFFDRVPDIVVEFICLRKVVVFILCDFCKIVDDIFVV